MKMVALLILLAVTAPVSALSLPGPPCVDEEVVVESLDLFFSEYPVVAVIRIESEIEAYSVPQYSLVAPSLKEQPDDTGLLYLLGCGQTFAKGDLILVFGKIGQDGLYSEHAVKVYSSKLELVWSESTMAWVEQRVRNAT